MDRRRVKRTLVGKFRRFADVRCWMRHQCRNVHTKSNYKNRKPYSSGRRRAAYTCVACLERARWLSEVCCSRRTPNDDEDWGGGVAITTWWWWQCRRTAVNKCAHVLASWRAEAGWLTLEHCCYLLRCPGQRDRITFCVCNVCRHNPHVFVCMHACVYGFQRARSCLLKSGASKNDDDAGF